MAPPHHHHSLHQGYRNLCPHPVCMRVLDIESHVCMGDTLSTKLSPNSKKLNLLGLKYQRQRSKLSKSRRGRGAPQKQENLRMTSLNAEYSANHQMTQKQVNPQGVKGKCQDMKPQNNGSGLSYRTRVISYSTQNVKILRRTQHNLELPSCIFYKAQFSTRVTVCTMTH